MNLVDSHCHLDFSEFADLESHLKAARANKVGFLQTIGTRVSTFPSIYATAERIRSLGSFAGCSVGQHPNNVEMDPLTPLDPLLDHAAKPLTIGIGETGLDYYYEKSDRLAQQTSFRTHIEASRLTGLPLIVHTRNAEADTLAILQEETAKGPFPILIHCFTSERAFGEAVMELGAYISISGIVTFKNAVALQACAREFPLERLLVETDAPYLAPAPFRGKPCTPAYVKHTAEFIAAIRGLPADEVARVTTENFFRLFEKARGLCPEPFTEERAA